MLCKEKSSVLPFFSALGRISGRSVNLIVVVSTFITVVARGSRTRRLIGRDPKVMMDVIFDGVGEGASSSALMCKKNATTTLEFATIKDTEISTMAATASFSPPSVKT
jgi:hypothetical protein